MNGRYPSLITLAIVAYCLWNSQDLIYAWIKAPVEQTTFFTFFLWALPIFYFWIAKPHQSYSGNPFLLAIALMLSVAGTLGSINAISYWGFALALAALIPWSNWWLLWLPLAVCWMPMAGWLGTHLHGFMGMLFTIGRVLAAALIGLFACGALKEKFHLGKKE